MCAFRTCRRRLGARRNVHVASTSLPRLLDLVLRGEPLKALEFADHVRIRGESHLRRVPPQRLAITAERLLYTRQNWLGLSASDTTRTRDLRRDRPVQAQSPRPSSTVNHRLQQAF